MAVAIANEQSLRPRWLRAGPPYWLTRDELIAEMAARGFVVGEPQLRAWVSRGILPKPERRVPPLAEERLPRALYPAHFIPALGALLGFAQQGESLAEIKQRAPEVFDHWRHQVGEGAPPPPARAYSTLSGVGVSPAPTGSGASLVATPPPAIETTTGASGAATAGAAVLTGSATLQVAATVTPRLTRALQRAVWEYARRVAERNGVEIECMTLVAHMPAGEELPVSIPPPPAPRQRRRGKSRQTDMN